MHSMRLPGGLSVRALVVGLLGLAIVLVFVMPFLTPTPSSWIGSRTPATSDVIDLYWAMFAIAAVILLIVEGGIIASVILFRQRPGHAARAFHGNTLLEFTWTIIPAIIVLGLSAFSFKSLSTLTNTADAQMTIEVTGRQWVWSFKYPDGLTVTTEAHIPLNTKIRFTITSIDVIHSFWVPRLSGKMDAVPGVAPNAIWIEATEAGAYSGQCTEFCGLGHADMLAKIVAPGSCSSRPARANRSRRRHASPATPSTQIGRARFRLLRTSLTTRHRVPSTIRSRRSRPPAIPTG
ncbi:MAG: cytochrome c oxidase subunit II [Chloroflexi bacterium 13_1_40CM_4_68_4]|nr:MAG: cytochrome c oxidase subunit II [Chloroflexi bacterium 13_1_40CM_4_68_4]